MLHLFKKLKTQKLLKMLDDEWRWQSRIVVFVNVKLPIISTVSASVKLYDNHQMISMVHQLICTNQ